MPYIKQELREELGPHIEALLDSIRKTGDTNLDGALNYVISRIVSESLEPVMSGWPYTSIARVVAVFECAKMEFYRRIAAPKEDKAIQENGDISAYGPYNR